MDSGVDGARRLRRALGIPPAAELLLGHGVSFPEQLLSTGPSLPTRRSLSGSLTGG